MLGACRCVSDDVRFAFAVRDIVFTVFSLTVDLVSWLAARSTLDLGVSVGCFWFLLLLPG